MCAGLCYYTCYSLYSDFLSYKQFWQVFSQFTMLIHDIIINNYALMSIHVGIAIVAACTNAGCCAAGCELSFIFANNEGPPELQPHKLSGVLTPQACRERWLAEARPVCRTARRGWRPRWNPPKRLSAGEASCLSVKYKCTMSKTS